MDDRIEVRGLRLLGTHGAFEAEQQTAQPFEVDLDLWTDLGVPAKTDQLTDTVSYASVIAGISKVVQQERYALLERLAERITEVVLEDSRVTKVSVTVRKLRPPVPADVAYTAVRITRP